MNASNMVSHHSVSLLDTFARLIRQQGGICAHFNVWQAEKDAGASSQDGAVRVYTLRGDLNRKIWLNGEHVASAVRW